MSGKCRGLPITSQVELAELSLKLGDHEGSGEPEVRGETGAGRGRG